MNLPGKELGKIGMEDLRFFMIDMTRMIVNIYYCMRSPSIVGIPYGREAKGMEYGITT